MARTHGLWLRLLGVEPSLHEGTAEALEAAVDRLKDVRLLHGMAVSPQTDVGLWDLIVKAQGIYQVAGMASTNNATGLHEALSYAQRLGTRQDHLERAMLTSISEMHTEALNTVINDPCSTRFMTSAAANAKDIREALASGSTYELENSVARFQDSSDKMLLPRHVNASVCQRRS